MLVWMTAACLLLLLLKIREFPVLQPESFSQTLDRRLKGKPQVSEHGLTSPPTHYRLYGRRGGGHKPVLCFRDVQSVDAVLFASSHLHRLMIISLYISFFITLDYG